MFACAPASTSEAEIQKIRAIQSKRGRSFSMIAREKAAEGQDKQKPGEK